MVKSFSFFLIAAVLSVGHVYADVLSPQRDLFSRVEGDMKLGRFASFRQNIAKLNNYPLFPYLEFYELRRRLTSAKESEIKNFLHKHAHIPVAERLRHDWIKHLARRGKWELLVDVYQPPMMLEGKKVTCYYATGLIRTNRMTELRRVLPGLWTVNFSQPKQCDFAFNWAFANGWIDDKMVWKRLLLTVFNNASLTRYLGGRLSAENRQWYRLLKKSLSRPEAVLSQLQKTFTSSAFAKDVAVVALKTLARRNVQTAEKKLNQLRSVCPTCPAMYAVQRDMGVFMSRQLETERAYEWLSLPPEYHTQNSIFWKIRTALRQEDWHKVLQSIALLNDKQRKLPQWRYWQASALYKTGRVDDALNIWKSLAKLPSYYGYLAADKVDANYQLDTTSPIEFSYAELLRFSERGPIARMRELIRLNRLVDARREFLFIDKRITHEEYLKLAVLADQWGWHDGAIRAIAASDFDTDMQLRFPLPYENEIQKAVQETGIAQEWIYAIMRRESAFMEKVKSPSGALGLMQLMPNTARIMLSSLKIKGRSQRHILRPNVNIKLGSAYFARLYRQYDYEVVPALAAYNAGGTPTRKWLKKATVSQSDIWVDTIPINETRLYVRAVLFYMIVYGHRLGKSAYRLEDIM